MQLPTWKRVQRKYGLMLQIQANGRAVRVQWAVGEMYSSMALVIGPCPLLANLPRWKAATTGLFFYTPQTRACVDFGGASKYPPKIES